MWFFLYMRLSVCTEAPCHFFEVINQRFGVNAFSITDQGSLNRPKVGVRVAIISMHSDPSSQIFAGSYALCLHSASSSREREGDT